MALSQILNHAAQAVVRLAAQFVEAPLIKGMVTAIGNEVQAIEDGVYLLLKTRDIANATGDALDQIGKLVNAPLRGSKTVARYRDRIRAQILANRSYGNSSAIYSIAPLIIPEWGNDAVISEDIACYIIGAAGVVNATEDAKDLARVLKTASSAGVRPIVLSQSVADVDAFCFENGSGQGFGDGSLVGAY